MLLDPAEAEDAAQETFLKAFASLHHYKKDLSFPAWLHRIGSNYCLDVLRKRKRRSKKRSLDIQNILRRLYVIRMETRLILDETRLSQSSC